MVIKIPTGLQERNPYEKAVDASTGLLGELPRGTKGQFQAGKEQFQKGIDIFKKVPEKATPENILSDTGAVVAIFSPFVSPAQKIDIAKGIKTGPLSTATQGAFVTGVGATTAVTSPAGGVGALVLPQSVEEGLGGAIESVEGAGAKEAEKRGLEPAFGEAVSGSAFGAGLGAIGTGAAIGLKGVFKGAARTKPKIEPKVEPKTEVEVLEDAVQTEKQIIPNKTETAENIETANIVDSKVDEFIENGRLIESPEFLEGLTKVDKNGIRQLKLKKAEPIKLNTTPIVGGLDFTKIKQPKGATLGKEISKTKELANRIRDINTNKRKTIQLIKSLQVDEIKNPELKGLLRAKDLQDLSIKNKKFTDLALQEAELFLKRAEALRVKGLKEQFKATLDKAKRRVKETEAQYKARIEKINKKNKEKLNQVKTDYAKRIGEVKSAAKGAVELRKEMVTKAKELVDKAFTTGEYGYKIVGGTSELQKIKGELLNSALQIKDAKSYDRFSEKLATVVNKNNFKTVDNRIKAKLKTIRKQLRKTKNQTNYAGDSIFELKAIANGYSDFRKSGRLEDLLKIEKRLNEVVKEGKNTKAEHARKVDEKATESANKILEEGIISTRGLDDTKILERAEGDRTFLSNLSESGIRNITRINQFAMQSLNPDRRISNMSELGYEGEIYKVMKGEITKGYSKYTLEFNQKLADFREKFESLSSRNGDELSLYGQLIQNVDNTKTKFEDKYAYGLKYVQKNTELPTSLKDIDTIKEIESKMRKDKEVQGMFKEFHKLMDDIYNDNNAVHFDIYGTPIGGKIKNYYAVLGSNANKNESFLAGLLESGESVGDALFRQIKQGTKDGFTLTRQGVQEHRGGSDFFTDVAKMLETQLYYKHLQKPIVEAFRVREKIKGNLTKADDDFLVENLHYTATKGGEFQLDTATKIATTAGFIASSMALIFKPSTAIKQFLGYTDTVEIGGHHMGIGARYSTPENYKFARENSSEMFGRLLGDDQMQLYTNLTTTGKLSGGLNKAFQKYVSVGLYPMKAVDTFVANNVWWAALNKRLYDTGRKDLASEIDRKLITEDDILYADRMVSNKLNSGALINRPPLLRDPLNRLILTLQSTVVNRLGILTTDTKQMWKRGSKFGAVMNVVGRTAGMVGDSVITSMASLQKQVLGMKDPNLTEEQKEKLELLLSRYPEELQDKVRRELLTEQVLPEFGSAEYFKWLTTEITGKEAKDISGEDIADELTRTFANQIPYLNNALGIIEYDSSGVPAADLIKKVITSSAEAYNNSVGKGLQDKKDEIESKFNSGEYSFQEKNLRLKLAELEADVATDNQNVLNLIGFFGGDIGDYIASKYEPTGRDLIDIEQLKEALEKIR